MDVALGFPFCFRMFCLSSAEFEVDEAPKGLEGALSEATVSSHAQSQRS